MNQGVAAWNNWRRDNCVDEPDLEGLNLGKRELQGIDFRKTDLYRASLWKADLTDANLQSSDQPPQDTPF